MFIQSTLLSFRHPVSRTACVFSPYWVLFVRRVYTEERVSMRGHNPRRLSSFADWIENKVRQMGIDGEQVSADVVAMSRLPSPYVKHHNSMWCRGYHFRTHDEEGRQHVTFDAGVAAIITQECRSSVADMNPIEADLQYVGIVKDIFTIDYGHLKFNVLKCSWIKPDIVGERTIKQDRDGFWLVKHQARQSPEVEPYIMAVHARQVRF